MAKTLRPCLCGQFEANGTSTGCTKTTRNDWAPGHDASLKSLLIKAGVAGQQIRRTVDGKVTTTDAVGAALEFGFAEMVRTGIERGRAKLAAKAARPARKPASPATEPTPTPAPAQAKIKVGRWVRDAQIDFDGTATYVDGKGKTVQVKADSYTLVD